MPHSVLFLFISSNVTEASEKILHMISVFFKKKKKKPARNTGSTNEIHLHSYIVKLLASSSAFPE